MSTTVGNALALNKTRRSYRIREWCIEYKDKDSNTGDTADAHVEATTTNEDPTTPNGGTSLGTHI